MQFYMKLASKKDNDKLKGIVLFEDFGKDYYGEKFGTLPLGTGKTTYKFDTYEEFVIPYTYEMKDIFERISSILPNARLCYVSAVDDGTGEYYIMLKMENCPKIYACSTMWYDDDIGSDSWCERAIKVIEEEELLLERVNERVRQMFEEDDDEDYEDDDDEDYEDDEDEDYDL